MKVKEVKEVKNRHLSVCSSTTISKTLVGQGVDNKDTINSKMCVTQSKTTDKTSSIDTPVKWDVSSTSVLPVKWDVSSTSCPLTDSSGHTHKTTEQKKDSASTTGSSKSDGSQKSRPGCLATNSAYVLANDSIFQRTLFMRDTKSVDFVIVSLLQDKHVYADLKRRTFEKNIKKEGLELDFYIDVQCLLRFVQIHATHEALLKYAEMLRYEMPIMKNDIIKERSVEQYGGVRLPIIRNFFNAQFSRDKAHCFLFGRNMFFSQTQRIDIVYHILKGTEFTYPMHERRHYGVGLNNLLQQNVYVAGFALHSGEVSSSQGYITQDSSVLCNLRHLLYMSWSRVSCLFYEQPIEHIRLYAGDSCGMFFAFVGLYIKMLIPLAVLGMSVLLYGILGIVLYVDADDICDPKGAGNVIMCPLCEGCRVWKLSDSCYHHNLNYVLDNGLGIIYSMLIPVWSIIFIEMWHRQQTALIQTWHIRNRIISETVRPEFLRLASSEAVNPVTGIREPVLPKELKNKRQLASLVVMILSLSVVFVAFTFVIDARPYVRNRNLETVILQGESCPVRTHDHVRWKELLISALTNASLVHVLNVMFMPVARLITNYELPRTESEWQNKYVIKLFVFMFINTYLYVIYVAFLRDLIHYEDISDQHSLASLGNLNKAGGLLEICVTITCILLLNIVKDLIIRLGRHRIMYFFKRLNFRIAHGGVSKGSRVINPLLSNFFLLDIPPRFLLEKYIGYFIQYSMVTCFASAVPYAAMCALFSNLFAMRLTANNIMTVYRRTIDARLMRDATIWLKVMKILLRVSTVINACLIAFRSEFIKLLLYDFTAGREYRYAGFYNFSLSTMNRSSCNLKLPGDEDLIHEKTCHYFDFREPPHVTTSGDYSPTLTYWQYQTVKFGFIIVFVGLVELASPLLIFLLPKEKSIITLQRLREEYIARKKLHPKQQ